VHGTARKCTALHASARHCTQVHGTARKCTALHATVHGKKLVPLKVSYQICHI